MENNDLLPPSNMLYITKFSCCLPTKSKKSCLRMMVLCLTCHPKRHMGPRTSQWSSNYHAQCFAKFLNPDLQDLG